MPAQDFIISKIRSCPIAYIEIQRRLIVIIPSYLFKQALKCLFCALEGEKNRTPHKYPFDTYPRNPLTSPPIPGRLQAYWPSSVKRSVTYPYIPLNLNSRRVPYSYTLPYDPRDNDRTKGVNFQFIILFHPHKPHQPYS